MVIRVWRAVLLVIVLSSAISCSLLGGRGESSASTGFILFDSFELSDEWGYWLRGFYVDANGSIWRYERREPWFPSEQRSEFVSEADLLRKHDGAERIGSVDPRVLREMKALIEEAAGGKVVRDPLSYERSGKLDVAYLYDPRLRRYQLVFINGSGSWVARNHSSQAGRLLQWLEEVRRAVDFPSAPSP